MTTTTTMPLPILGRRSTGLKAGLAWFSWVVWQPCSLLLPAGLPVRCEVSTVVCCWLPERVTVRTCDAFSTHQRHGMDTLSTYVEHTVRCLVIWCRVGRMYLCVTVHLQIKRTGRPAR